MWRRLHFEFELMPFCRSSEDIVEYGSEICYPKHLPLGFICKSFVLISQLSTVYLLSSEVLQRNLTA
jgi:hypothetical protein